MLRRSVEVTANNGNNVITLLYVLAAITAISGLVAHHAIIQNPVYASKKIVKISKHIFWVGLSLLGGVLLTLILLDI